MMDALAVKLSPNPGLSDSSHIMFSGPEMFFLNYVIILSKQLKHHCPLEIFSDIPPHYDLVDFPVSF